MGEKYNREKRRAEIDAEAMGIKITDYEKFKSHVRTQNILGILAVFIVLALGSWIGYSLGFNEGIMNTGACAEIIEAARNLTI